MSATIDPTLLAMLSDATPHEIASAMTDLRETVVRLRAERDEALTVLRRLAEMSERKVTIAETHEIATAARLLLARMEKP